MKKTLLSAFAGALMLAPAAYAEAPYSYAVGDKVTVDGEELTIMSENLFPDGNFANFFEGWTVNGITDEVPLSTYWENPQTGGPNDGSYVVTVKGTEGSGKPGTIKKTFEMTPGKTYYFFAYAQNGGTWQRLCTGASEGATGADHVCDFTSGAEWTKDEAIIRVDANNCWGMIQCAWLGTGFALADISLYEVEAPEVEALCQPDTYYKFFAADADTYLSANDGWLTMESADTEDVDQFFSLVETETEGVYNLATSTGEFFIVGSNKWDSTIAADVDLSDTKAQVSIQQKGQVVAIKSIFSAYFGSDNKAAAGSGVYCDKNGDATIWFSVIEPEDAPEPDFSALEAAVDEAMNLLNDAVIGTDKGNYPQEAADELEAAMEEAEAALDAKTQAVVNIAAAKMQEAVQAFKDAEIQSSGLANVSAAQSVEYFNLQGIRVAEPTEGLFIRRQGNTVKTVLVK